MKSKRIEKPKNKKTKKIKKTRYYKCRDKECHIMIASDINDGNPKYCLQHYKGRY